MRDIATSSLFHDYATLFATLIALMLPMIIILIRGNLRNERIGLIQEIEKAFDFKETIPSFEFVKSKYFDQAAQISAGQLYLSALPYMAISALGLLVIFTPIDAFIKGSTTNRYPLPEIIFLVEPLLCQPTDTAPCQLIPVLRPLAPPAGNAGTGAVPETGASPAAAPAAPPAGAGAAQPAVPSAAPPATTPPAPSAGAPNPAAAATSPAQNMARSMTILAFTFAGAILFSLTYLMRAVANFELGPLTFLRVTVHMLFAVATVMTLWRILPGLTDYTVLAGIFYGVAFAVGFFPEFGLRFLVSKLALPMKGYRQDLTARAPVIPIEVIDGIDSSIAYRLQEQQIYDVQNLATFNPLMLHVETPFGLYESIDWVAQAQLCTVVGADIFFALRERNIRTIFDLERATVDSRATPALRRDLGRTVFKLQDGDIAPVPVAPPVIDPGAAQPAPATATTARFSDADILLLFEVMIDDLHVHRLRQIWELIVKRLGPQYSHLSPITPAGTPPATPPVTPPGERP